MKVHPSGGDSPKVCVFELFVAAGFSPRPRVWPPEELEIVSPSDVVGQHVYSFKAYARRHQRGSS